MYPFANTMDSFGNQRETAPRRAKRASESLGCCHCKHKDFPLNVKGSQYSKESRKRTGSAADLGPGGLQFFYYRLAGFLQTTAHNMRPARWPSSFFLLQTTIRPSSFYYRLQFARPLQFLLQGTPGWFFSRGRLPGLASAAARILTHHCSQEIDLASQSEACN